jgi:hypothetical protein
MDIKPIHFILSLAIGFLVFVVLPAMLLLRLLFKCRARRASWAYILWILAYLPLMVFVSDFVFFRLRPYQYLPLLIPLAVVIVQLAYPTLLGWAVVVIPSVFVAGVGVVSVVITVPARDLPHDLGRLVISSIAAGVYVLVCVALWYARPKPVDSVAVEPVAPPSGVETATRASHHIT